MADKDTKGWNSHIIQEQLKNFILADEYYTATFIEDAISSIDKEGFQELIDFLGLEFKKGKLLETLPEPVGGKYNWWVLCNDQDVPPHYFSNGREADIPDGVYPIKVSYCRSIKGTSSKTVKICNGVIDHTGLFKAIDELAFNCGWDKDSGPPDHRFVEGVTPMKGNLNKGRKITHFEVSFGS